MTDPTMRDAASDGEVQATTREPDTSATLRVPAASATVGASGAASTAREDRASGAGEATLGSQARLSGGNAGLVRLPAGLASRYRIGRELPTRGTEADLFVVRPLQDDDGTPVVVKLANVQPKDEVRTRICGLDAQHLIGQLEHGVSEGRSYEVIEYAPSGSLVDLMRGCGREQETLRRFAVHSQL